MNELALFAGGGGGLLASQCLLGFKTVCYVEINAYCVEILKARIWDGLLDDSPIWDDVRTFDGRIWRGKVDLITAGFPCQPWSVAGKQKGEQDDRNLWPDTIRICREVKPEFIFLENVPTLLAGTHGYFGQILGDLSKSGYNARWCVLSAAGCGAPHLRKRIWIFAYACNSRWGQLFQQNSESGSRITSDFGCNGKIQSVAYTSNEGLPCTGFDPQRSKPFIIPSNNSEEAGQTMADSQSQQGRRIQQREIQTDAGTDRTITWWKRDPAEPEYETMADTQRGQSCIGDDGRTSRIGKFCPSEGKIEKDSGGRREGNGNPKTEPELGRVADGVAHRMDRLRAIGNGQVPAVAAKAWCYLTQEV